MVHGIALIHQNASTANKKDIILMIAQSHAQIVMKMVITVKTVQNPNVKPTMMMLKMMVIKDKKQMMMPITLVLVGEFEQVKHYKHILFLNIQFCI